MKILVTGASGFIGAPVCHRLVQLGHDVVAMYRNSSRLSAIQHERITTIEGDVTSLSDLQAAMRSCDACIHLAAIAMPWSRHPEDFTKVNVEGTRSVFMAAQQFELKRIVFTSTASIFGPANRDNPITEASPCWPHLDTAYERSKQACEAVVAKFQSAELDIVTAYPSRVYGPGLLGQSNALTRIFKRFDSGTWRFIPGNGNSVGNYVFINDVVEGLCGALIRGERNARYLLCGENLSFNQMMEQLRNATGNRSRMIHVPPIALSMFARAQVVKSMLSGRQPMITPSFVRKYLKSWYIDCSISKSELGIHKTPFSEGLEQTLDWIRTQSG